MTAHSRSAAVPSLPPLDQIPGRPLTIRSLDAHKANLSTSQILRRIRGEFAEMRGFSPTLAQAARLFDLPPDICSTLLMTMVRDGSLRCCEDGRYRLV